MLQVGTLLSVHVHSYQSHEAHQPDPPPPPEGSELTRRLLSKVGLAPSSRGITPGYGRGGYGPGHDEHFDVTVYRNVAAVGGPAIEHLPIGLMVNEQQKKKAGYLGHNEHGRERILADWLEGGGRSVGLSPLRRQRPTMYLLSRMYEMLALNRASLHTLEPEGEEAPAARSGRRPSLPAATHKVNAIHRQVSEPEGQEAQAARSSRRPVYALHRQSSSAEALEVAEAAVRDPAVPPPGCASSPSRLSEPAVKAPPPAETQDASGKGGARLRKGASSVIATSRIGRRYSAPPMVFSVNENDSQDTTRLQPVPESPRRENTIS